MDRAVRGTAFLLWARHVIRKSGADLRDPRAIADAVRSFVASRLVFVRDPLGIEHVATPTEHMAALDAYGVIAGDCDDAATLAASIGRALGLRATFTIESFDWGPGLTPYQHVYATLHPAPRQGDWQVRVDTTRDAQQLPPKVERQYTEYAESGGALRLTPRGVVLLLLAALAAASLVPWRRTHGRLRIRAA